MKKFVILGQPRTGSTLLHSTLLQHPSLRVYGELFHKIRNERIKRHHVKINSDVFIYDGLEGGMDFLERTIWKNEPGLDAFCIGFKLFPSHLIHKGCHTLLEDILKKEDIKIIHIHRKNYLDIWASFEKASQKKQFAIFEGQRESEISVKPVDVTPEELKRYFDEIAEENKHISTLYSGDRYLRVEYNDLAYCLSRTMNSVFEFLGVCNIDVRAKTYKQNVSGIKDLIRNYETVRRYFSGSEYSGFFDEEPREISSVSCLISCAMENNNIAVDANINDLSKCLKLEGHGPQGENIYLIEKGGGKNIKSEKPIFFFKNYPSCVIAGFECLYNIECSHVRVLEISKSYISGKMLIAKDNRLFYDESIYPGYLERTYQDKDYHAYSYLDFDRDCVLKGDQQVSLSSPAYVFYHSSSVNYGNFLTEAFPKLFTISKLYKLGLRFPIIIERYAPHYICEYLRLVIPDADIFLTDYGVRYHGNFLVPSIDVNCIYHPSRLKAIHKFADEICQKTPNKTPEYIFVSRSFTNKPYRMMRNREEIEMVAQQYGFTIVRPEEFPITDQIKLFRNARIVVGEYGSGLNNTIFSKEGTLVLALNWINLVQQGIAVSCRHKLGFVLPDSGIPTLHMPEMAQQGYSISVNEFSDAIKMLLFYCRNIGVDS